MSKLDNMRKNIIIFIAGIMIFSLTACSSKEQEIPQNETNVTTNDEIEQDVTLSEGTSTHEDVDEFTVIDTFIEKYNAITDDQITDVSEMDIQGDDYRTEFRLNAFKNALGKKGTITVGNIEIVNYGEGANDTVRFYVNTDSLDTAIDIYTQIIHTLDSTITDDEIKDSYSSLEYTDMANIYLGSTGYISGYINGNEIMVNCEEINYME